MRGQEPLKLALFPFFLLGAKFLFVVFGFVDGPRMATFGKTPKKASPLYLETVEKSSLLFDLATKVSTTNFDNVDCPIQENDNYRNSEQSNTWLVKHLSFSFLETRTIQEPNNGLCSEESIHQPPSSLERSLQPQFCSSSPSPPFLWHFSATCTNDCNWDQFVIFVNAYIHSPPSDEEHSNWEKAVTICKEFLRKNISFLVSAQNPSLSCDEDVGHEEQDFLCQLIDEHMDLDTWEECVEHMDAILWKMAQSLLYAAKDKHKLENTRTNLSMWIILFVSLYCVSLVAKDKIVVRDLVEIVQWLSKACDLSCFPDIVKDVESLCIATLLEKLSSRRLASSRTPPKDDENHSLQRVSESYSIWLWNHVACYATTNINNSNNDDNNTPKNHTNHYDLVAIVAQQQRKRALCIACLRVLVNLSSDNQEWCKTTIDHRALLNLIRLLHRESILVNRTDFDLRVTCLVLMINILLSFPSCATWLLHIRAVCDRPSRKFSQPAIFPILVKYIIPPIIASETCVEHQTTVAYVSILLACLINGQREWITVSRTQVVPILDGNVVVSDCIAVASKNGIVSFDCSD